MKKRTRWTLLTLLSAALLVVPAYFFLTGSFFLTKVALPVLSRRWGVEVAADRVELSLFQNRIAVVNFRIGPEDRPLFQAERGEAHWACSSLLPGEEIKLSECRIAGAQWRLYYPGDGAGHLENPPSTEERAEEPFRIDLEDVVFRDSSLRIVWGDPEEGRFLELSGLELRADRFANRRPMRLAAAGKVRFAAGRENRVEAERFDLRLDAGIDAGLLPERFDSSVSFSNLSCAVAGAPFQVGALALTAEGGCDSNRFELRKLFLNHQLRDGAGSELELAGRVRFEPFEVRGGVEIRQFPAELNSLLDKLRFGFRPGQVELRHRGEFVYAQRKLAATGTLRAERRGEAVRDSEHFPLPPLRLDGEYDFSVDFGAGSLDLRKMVLTLAERGNPAASLRLQQPIRCFWQARQSADAQPVTFDLEFRRLDLTLLRPLIPNGGAFQIESGRYSSRLQLRLPPDLAGGSLRGTGRISDGVCRWNGKSLASPEIDTELDWEIGRDLHWNLRNLALVWKRGGTDLGKGRLTGEGEFTCLTGKLFGKLELAPELAAEISPAFEPVLAGYRKLGFDPAEIDFELVRPARDAPVELRKLAAAVNRDGVRALTLQAGPYRFGGSEAGGDEWKFQLTGELPVSVANIWLAPRVRFDSGRVKVLATGAVAPDFRSAIVSGQVGVDGIAARVAGRTYRDLSLQGAFSGRLPAWNRLEMPTLTLELLRFGNPALHLECPGTLDFERASYSGDWSFRDLNGQFLALLFPEAVAEARLTGKLRLAAQEKFRVLHASGTFELEKLVLPQRPDEVYTGTLAVTAEKDEKQLYLPRISAVFEQGGSPLFDLSGECRTELAAPDGLVAAQLASNYVDAEKLLAWFPPREQKRGEEPHPGRAPRLDFGRRPVDLACQLRKIRLSPALSANLDSRLRLRGDSFETDRLLLQLNEARFDGKLRGVNTERGVLFSASWQGDDPISLPPLLEVIAGPSPPEAAGTLRTLKGDLHFLEDGRPDTGWETLSGTLALRFRNLSVPAAVQGKFTHLLLLPIELVGNLSTMLSDDLTAWKMRLISGETLNWHLKTVKFEEGTVKLQLNDGLARIDECVFWGDWVNRLAFSGSFDLARERELHLASTLTVGGLPATIPIGGTLDHPFVRLESMASGSLEALLMKIRELKVIGIATDPFESLILLDQLPSAGMIRELRKLFNQILVL